MLFGKLAQKNHYHCAQLFSLACHEAQLTLQHLYSSRGLQNCGSMQYVQSLKVVLKVVSKMVKKLFIPDCTFCILIFHAV
jgi:hypothetical protein